ncbi:UDP-N-acetylglucosamine transferase subunit ALG14 [Coprinopsis cinerea okayama7|uniref:UDP-N-acetylglucosamine transferase subunit ALG14 n=1 Tax=Coprinopsis cinerea (strain Okayama-7 / 130 / ATCC MYA-4618 / FGSC 9003) TaxID=240176 RepID=A8N5I2_COPC7|nr:UDP-N-acetylglucosamine transferase subunit ALG14 [Coprinopsis cinerea okayama7\|eukprot:XP_001830127.2 UDP-N-acetylglucosamine transferase subunit ALG14 [Coprinopsis cinerea okayama7\
MTIWLSAILGFSALSLVLLFRLFFTLPATRFKKPASRKPSATCSLAVFLGSGGHTSEALALLKGVDLQRYQPRHYFVSEGDNLSVKQVVQFEQSRANNSSSQYRVTTIPRARRVHQPLITTPLTALISTYACVYYFMVEPFFHKKCPFPEVLIMNGPGTCFILCVAVYWNKLLGLPAPTTIYVESFTRVKGLSLTGKLIRPMVDRSVRLNLASRRSHAMEFT